MPRWPVIFSLLLVALSADAEPPVSEKIIARYKQMLAANPAEGTALDRLWKAYGDAGKTGELIDDYKSTGGFSGEMIAGLLLKKAARPDEAAAAFRRAAKLAPDNPQPILALAQSQLDAGHSADAATLFEKAAKMLPASDPRLPETLLQCGSAWLASGDLENACAAWERTVSANPSDLALRRRLAETYAQNHLPDRAIPHLEYLKQHAPPAERAQALQQLARLHQGAGRQDAAIAALEEALVATAPGNWLRGELEAELIRLHQRYHRTAELEEKLKGAAKENPRDLGAQLELIGFYERLGDLEQERACLANLTALAPKTAEYQLRLARLDARMDRLESAASIYDTLLKSQPENPELVFERARIDVQRDALPAARTRIAALLAAKPADESLRQKAMEFYQNNRLTAAEEELLTNAAASASEDSLLALTRFLFAENRAAEAQRTLARLVHPGDSPTRRAAAQFQIAGFLKDQNEPAAATAAVSSAIALQPESREFHLLLGDLEATQGHEQAAREACEKAYALSRTPAESQEADQKLFGIVSGAHAATVARGADATSPALADYLLKLTREAAEAKTVGGWLRVARWQSWNRSPRVSQECAQQALALDPRSIAAHEFLADLGANDPRSTLPLAHLDELMKLNPAASATYQRRAAEANLRAGRVEEALRIFTELADENPGDATTLTDLATAQQRADRWTDALATWRKIFAMTPVPRRKESAAAILRIYDRLNLPSDAATLLLQQVEAQTTEHESFAAFQDLLTFCEKHDMLGWLRTEFEERHKTRADDYFTGMSLGRILKETGEKARAFDLLSDASFAAPDQALALPELVREAEDLHKIDAAVRLQSQLVRIVSQTTPDGLIKLAQLQEKTFKNDDAGATWERIAMRFPRDADALQQAVDFQMKWGTPARALALLRRIRTLDPGNLRALAALAELTAEAGSAAEARSCLEEILSHSKAENSGDPIRFPSFKSEEPGQLQNAYLSAVKMRGGRPTADALVALRSFWVEEPAGVKPEADARLRAIRDLAQSIATNGTPSELAQWVARWRSAASQSPGEAIWALFYAGASSPLLDHVEALMLVPKLAAPSTQAFIWFALKTGEYDRLAAWLHDERRTAADRDYFQVALTQHLQAGSTAPDPALVAKLFTKDYPLRLWQAALTFANRGHFREAVQLGQRVFDSLSSQRPPYGIELAHWHLYLGEADAARRVLHDSLAGAGEAFEAPFYKALREYFLLLPEPDQKPFASDFLKHLDPAMSVHTAICGTLLHALSGDETAARDDLRRLLALRPISQIAEDDTGNSASRGWNFILNAGVQLETWKLYSLAIFLWENALDDEAIIRLQMLPQREQVGARVLEIRTHLAALKIVRARPEDVEKLTSDYARYPGVEGLLPLAETLSAMGAHSQSIAILRRLWEREPTNPLALRNLLNECHASSDNDALAAVLTRCVEGGFFLLNDAANRDLTLQLADALEPRGESEKARAALERCLKAVPRDSRLQLRLALLHENAGQLDRAESVYRKVLGFEPANIAACLALASLLERQNRAPEAIELLEKSPGTEADAMLAQLYAATGRIDDAFAAIERQPASSQLAAVLPFIDRLVKCGDLNAARSALRNALAKAPDASADFTLQSKLIELLTLAHDRATIAREMRRLRQMAGENPTLLGGYYDLALREMPRLGMSAEFAAALAQDADGGSLVAATTLLQWQFAHGDAEHGAQICARLFARDNLSEPILRKLVSILTEAAQPTLAVRAEERLARLNPLDVARMLDWARGLHGAGRTADAVKVLEELGRRAVFDDDLSGKVAQAFADLGIRPRADHFFQQAISGDPCVQRYQVFLDYARFLTNADDFPRAAKALRIAFQNRANQEYADIADFLRATDRLDHFDDEIQKFLPDPARRPAAWRACFSHDSEVGLNATALGLAQKILGQLPR